jgi:hypothetical protein
MIPPPNSFSQEFDSIEIDAAPLREAIESAMTIAAPADDALLAPGFHLLDDAGGRFVIDRDIGVISLADEALLERERGAVHAVHMRVIEPSGASYDLDMKLRITGRVPQMVGADDFAALAAMTDETVLTATRVPVLIAPAAEAAPAVPAELPWTRYAAAQGYAGRAPRTQSRRGFIAAELPAAAQSVSFAFDGLPASFPAYLPWSL